jgi:hypothetical protein
MATDKLYTVVGTSKLDGVTKVRFANDTMRTKVLQKHGHEDIILVELPEAVSKFEAVKAIQGDDAFANAASQAAIADYLEDKAPKAAPAPKAKVSKPVATATKTPATKVAKATENEDAPF